MTARVTIIDDNGNNKGTYELNPTSINKGDLITKYVFEFMYTEVNDEKHIREVDNDL
jgi:hypothetical protein